MQTQNGTPPDYWEQSAPTRSAPAEIRTEPGQGLNPFQDDATPLPAPTSQRSKLNGAIPVSQAIHKPAVYKPRSTVAPATVPSAIPKRSIPIVSRNTGDSGNNRVPRRRVKATAAPAASLPLKGPRTTEADAPPLKILVSSPIDTPVKALAPIEAPPDINSPAAQAATLAGLEQMLEVPVVGAASYDQPAVVQNEFARQ
jgi:hypothetical protein